MTANVTIVAGFQFVNAVVIQIWFAGLSALLMPISDNENKADVRMFPCETTASTDNLIGRR